MCMYEIVRISPIYHDHKNTLFVSSFPFKTALIAKGAPHKANNTPPAQPKNSITESPIYQKNM